MMNQAIISMDYPAVLEELKTVWKDARPYMAAHCRACRICNSVNCDMVSSERSGSAERNYKQLQKVRLIYDTLYDGGDGTEIDASVELYGHTFRAPIMCAPFGNVHGFNPSTHFEDDYLFNKALLTGCREAGIFSWTPDTLGELAYTDPLRALKEEQGVGIPAIKSWTKEEIQKKIRMAEEVGCMAIGHDIDCVGLPYLSINGHGKTYTKSPAQIKDIFSVAKTPYILKGIMTARGALKAMEAGASGIVISNHAGNSMDQSLSTVEVLPAIKAAVGGRMKIFVDGGVRHGEDVFKMLALGADAVMVGRPYLIAAEGGEARGVALYSQKLIWELQNAMRMTGCRTLADITKDHVAITND
ncbi:MAG: alpha-hydroxy-acid oxidizing protein [Clostridia bacterium]|nr:alpha-hydroxy-acid oxidizing protein [Clostridia bacterium]